MLRVDIGSWGPKKVPEHEGWEESLGFDRDVLVEGTMTISCLISTLCPGLCTLGFWEFPPSASWTEAGTP